MVKKVSIILSTYNEAFVIEDAINKIFKYLDNVEIILVDDNSPDGTFEKAKKIKSKSKIFLILDMYNSYNIIIGHLSYLIK